jgi:zinc protease
MIIKQAHLLILCTVVSLTWIPALAAEDYHEAILENGLRVVTISRPEVPMVALTTIVGAGSALEEESFSGASHFLEHLLFNGTATMNQEELYAAVDRIGGYNNAHTDDDHTYFVLLVPSEHLQSALTIQSAMLFDSTIPEMNYEKERKIVLEEIAKDRSQPDHEIGAAVRKNLWPGTAWGRSVIGSYESLAGIERDHVVEYYNRRYVPGNMTLLVIGDFEHDQTMAWVRESYRSSREGDVPEVSDPWQTGDSGSAIRVSVEGDSTRFAVALPAPGVCSDGGAEAEILAELLASESGPLRAAFGARLERIGASLVSRPRGSAIVIQLTPATGEDPEAILAGVLKTLDEVARSPKTAPGLDATSVLRAIRAGRSSSLLMGQRLHYLGMMLADSVAACEGSPRRVLTDETVVDPAGVARIAGEILVDLSTRARVVIAGRTDAAGTPLPKVSFDSPGPAIGSPVVPGADSDFTFENGLRLLSIEEPGSAVTGFHLLVRSRSAREPEGREGLADVLHRMLKEGTRISDRARLEARLQRIGAELKTADSDFIPYDDYYTSPDHSYIRLEVPSENWLAALDLLAELIRTPALSESALAPMIEKRIRRAQKVADSPAEVGDEVYREAMLGRDNPYAARVGGRTDTLQGVTRDELKTFANSYFDPAGLILTVASPYDVEDVLGAVEERFGSAASHGAEIPSYVWPTTGKPGKPVERSLGADQARFYMGRIAELPSRDRAGLSLLAAVLSDRLVLTLREREGLAYRLGASAHFKAAPDLGWMSVSIGTRSENLSAARDGIRREMELLQQEMADEEEMNRIRATVRGRSLMRRMTTVNRARYLGLRVYRNVASREDPDFLDSMDRVSRDDLKRLAATWLDPELFRVVIVD